MSTRCRLGWHRDETLWDKTWGEYAEALRESPKPGGPPPPPRMPPAAFTTGTATRVRMVRCLRCGRFAERYEIEPYRVQEQRRLRDEAERLR